MNLLTLNDLCIHHERGRLSPTDHRWQTVQDALLLIAQQEVQKVTRELFGLPLEHLVDFVYTALLTKFVAKKFKNRRGAPHVIIRKAARNETMTYFRRSRSPSTVGFDGSEKTWLARPCLDGDRQSVGERVDECLCDFRFPEYGTVRSAVHGFFVANGGYPGPAFVMQFGVPEAIARPVYNAAVCDLNTAMMRVAREMSEEIADVA